jgi:hypothetical protein
MRLRSKAPWACLLLFLAAAPGIARAQGEDDPHLVAGANAFRHADYPTAVSELNASLQAHPTAKAALYLGNTYLMQGQLGSARDALKRALELDPKTSKRAGILSIIHSIEIRTHVKVTVTSSPPGAQVFVDAQKGTPRGTTPLEFMIHVGSHKLLTVLDDYDTDTHKDDFVVGDPVTIAITLKPKGCDVRLSAVPPKTRASVDGGGPLTLPATARVRKGSHKVAFTADGFAPKELVVACAATEPLTVDAALVAIPPTGKLKVSLTPGATLLIDRKPADPRTIDADGRLVLSVGRHEITVLAPDRPPWTTTIDVGLHAELDVTPPPPPPAPPAPPPPSPGFPSRAFYVGVQGGGNLVLRSWDLGANAFVSQGGRVSSVTRKTASIYPGSSGMGGLRVGLQVVPRFAVEAEVQALALPNPLDTSIGLTYDVNGVVNILKGRWTPVVEGGIGEYQVISGNLGEAVDLRGHLGLGLRGRVTRWLTLRVDARDVVSRGFSAGGSNNVEILGGVEAFVPPPAR